MSKVRCSVCRWEKTHGIPVDGSHSAEVWATRTGIHRTTITRHLGHSELVIMKAATEAAAGPTGEEDYQSTDGKREVVLPRNRALTMEDAREWLRSTGDDPDDYHLSIRAIAYGGDKYSNRMSAWPKPGSKAAHAAAGGVTIDPVDILTKLRNTPASDRPAGRHRLTALGDQDSTFILSINDIQLGQSYNGGSPATITAFHEFVELAVARIHELRTIGRKLERLVLVLGGDLVEGCFIYPHQSHSIDLTRKQQVEGVVALLIHALDTIAPLFPAVTVLAVKGNHGENRVDGKKTTLGDNDDTLCAEMAKLALARDATMQHIDWIIAGEEAGVHTQVYDWTLVTTHGDIYAKGVAGPTVERKAHAWVKNMAASFRKFGNLGRPDVLITHHFHHDEMADWGDTLWRQTTSQDRGSPEFSQATGLWSQPGMLSAVMTPTSRWQDETVLRPANKPLNLAA